MRNFKFPVILGGALLFTLIHTTHTPAWGQDPPAAEGKEEPPRFLPQTEIVIGGSNEDEKENRKKEKKKQPKKEEFPQFGFWSITTGTDPFDRETISLQLDSSNLIPTAREPEEPATMILRCKEKRTEVYIDWPDPLQHKGNHPGYINITHMTDPQNRETEKWDLSTDNYAAFAPGPAALIRKVRTKPQAIFEVYPHTILSPQEVIFDLNGIDQALQVLITRCYD